jgi:hypothetical protein
MKINLEHIPFELGERVWYITLRGRHYKIYEDIILGVSIYDYKEELGIKIIFRNHTVSYERVFKTQEEAQEQLIGLVSPYDALYSILENAKFTNEDISILNRED